MRNFFRLTAGLALSGALLFTAACGGDAESGDGTGTSSASAFQDCLEENGVTMPGGRGGGRPSGAPTDRPSGAPTDRPSDAPTDRPEGAPTDRPEGAPTGRPSGAPTDRPSGGPSMSTEMRAAMEACASLRPEGGPGGPGDGGRQQNGG